MGSAFALANVWPRVRVATREGPHRELEIPMTNARKSERVTINKEFDTFDQFIEEYVTNISRSGAFVKTSTPLPVGTEVDLRFTVVMDGIETIEGIGEVVRVETDPAGMGVVFKELSGYSAQLIEKLLTAKGG
jgi:hypothetical protein